MPLWKKPEKQSLVLIAYDVDTGEKKTEFYCDEGGVIQKLLIIWSHPQKMNQNTVPKLFNLN